MKFKNQFLSIFILFSIACSGGGNGGGSDETTCTTTDCGASVTLDADADGLISACDSDDADATNITPTSSCDSDGDGYVDGDGSTQITCLQYDDNGDGVIDIRSGSTDTSYELTYRYLCDNCPSASNSDQTDSDSDLYGDACDCVATGADTDGDCIDDTTDNCVGTYNYDQTNSDTDQYGDACDADDEGDGVLDDSDNCPDVSNATQTDTDADGTGDYCDDDRDGDNITDSTDYAGAAITGGTDSCPTIGAASYTSYQVSGTDTASWNGCCYETDGDGICDNLELPGCVNFPGTSCIPTDSDDDDMIDVYDPCPGHADNEESAPGGTKDGEGYYVLENSSDTTDSKGDDYTTVGIIICGPGCESIDLDGDGQSSDEDYGYFMLDTDGDGTPNACD